MVDALIFDCLEQLGVIGLIRDNTEMRKSARAGTRDLYFDRLDSGDGPVVISMAQYFEQNGDLCCDPDMEIRVDLQSRLAEALTFEQALPQVHQRVYASCGSCDLALRDALNGFLADWLRACVATGHRFQRDE